METSHSSVVDTTSPVRSRSLIRASKQRHIRREPVLTVENSTTDRVDRVDPLLTQPSRQPVVSSTFLKPAVATSVTMYQSTVLCSREKTTLTCWDYRLAVTKYGSSGTC